MKKKEKSAVKNKEEMKQSRKYIYIYTDFMTCQPVWGYFLPGKGIVYIGF